MGRLTTHVLDTMAGRPAVGLEIELWRVATGAAGGDASGEGLSFIKSVRTNADGRVDAPLLEGDQFALGVYELRFHAANYLASQGVALGTPPFLSVIPIRFGMDESDGHYHVPLLLSPYGYSTYRGS